MVFADQILSLPKVRTAEVRNKLGISVACEMTSGDQERNTHNSNNNN